jgi:glycine/D-amino acid oxidase-like deaminating enzyme
MTKMAQTTDVVIIGAGIMGCATAYHLAQRGVQVTVVEKATVGAGGTGRSSAIIRQHYSNELTARMALHSLRVFQEWDDRVGGEVGFEQTGWVALADARNKEGLEANVKLQQGYGIGTSLLGAEELLELVPGLEVEDVGAVAYEPQSGYADPHLTVNGYADAARRHGATIVVDCEVSGIRMAGDKVVGVDTTKGPFDAPVVVNCAGPWGARVAALAGVDVPIESCRVQVAVFRRPPGFVTHPVVMDLINGVYLRAETGGLTLLGSIDPGEANATVDPDDYAEHSDSEFEAEMGEQFVRRYPPMDLSESMGGYSSLYAVTPDWHPIIDEVPAGSGCYVCSGFSGHGYKLGPAVGLMTADLVTKVTEPEFAADLFRFSRYEENAPVRGQYEYSIAG